MKFKRSRQDRLKTKIETPFEEDKFYRWLAGLIPGLKGYHYLTIQNNLAKIFETIPPINQSILIYRHAGLSFAEIVESGNLSCSRAYIHRLFHDTIAFLSSPSSIKIITNNLVLSPKMSVLVLPLKNKTHNALLRHGINTIGNLITKTPQYLISLRGLGVTAIDDITSVLSLYHLELRAQLSPPYNNFSQ